MTPEAIAADLADHRLWLRRGSGKRLDWNAADLRGADLRGADLSGANLRGAALRGADLRGADLRLATGNMREVKSMQIDTWACTWWHPADGEPMLAIGCQSHPAAKWRKADPEWIVSMDGRAAAWAGKYLAHVLATVDLSPAVVAGKAEGAE